MRSNAGIPLGAMAFGTLAMGGGGWVTGGDIADDGCQICRTDTYSGYVRKTSDAAWRDLFKVGTTVASSDVSYPSGTYDVAICKANSNYLAVVYFGKLYMSSNNGGTMTPNSAFGTFTNAYVQTPNSDSARMSHKRMDFDPDDPLTLAVGLKNTGLRYTIDGGTTWTTHADIPAPTTGVKGIAVAFDRSSSQVSGRRQIVYCYVEGQGIYRSTTGITGAFTLIASQPTTAWSEMKVHPANGDLWAAGGDGVGGGGGPLRRWNPGTGWVTITGFTDAKAICCKPGNANVVYAINGGGKIRGSADAAAATPTFYSYYNFGGTAPVRAGGNIGWQSWTNEGYMSNGDAVYDPSADKIHVFEGIGTWTADTVPTTGSTNITYRPTSEGIENLVGMHVVTTWTNGHILQACQDRPAWMRAASARATYPQTHGPNNTQSLLHCNHVDWAYDNEDFAMMFAIFDIYGQIFYTTNRGATWTATADRPPNILPATSDAPGNIFVNRQGNAVILPNNDGYPSYTLDNGATWGACVFVGAEAHGTTLGWISPNYTLRTVRGCADKLNAGHFYLYNVGNNTGSAADLGLKGIWKSTDGGATFNRVKSTLIDTWVRDYWNSKIKQVPGKAGHFWFTAGPVGNPGDAPATNQIFISTDYMVTWTGISNANVREIRAFGFGKAAGNHTYPSIYAFAENTGLYRCIDFNPASIGSETWTLITQFPDGNMDYVDSLDGDMTTYGRIYFALSGSGFKKSEFAHTLAVS